MKATTMTAAGGMRVLCGAAEKKADASEAPKQTKKAKKAKKGPRAK